MVEPAETLDRRLAPAVERVRPGGQRRRAAAQPSVGRSQKPAAWLLDATTTVPNARLCRRVQDGLRAGDVDVEDVRATAPRSVCRPGAPPRRRRRPHAGRGRGRSPTRRTASSSSVRSVGDTVSRSRSTRPGRARRARRKPPIRPAAPVMTMTWSVTSFGTGRAYAVGRPAWPIPPNRYKRSTTSTRHPRLSSRERDLSWLPLARPHRRSRSRRADRRHRAAAPWCRLPHRRPDARTAAVRQGRRRPAAHPGDLRRAWASCDRSSTPPSSSPARSSTSTARRSADWTSRRCRTSRSGSSASRSTRPSGSCGSGSPSSGPQIERDVRLVGFEQDDEGVTATLEGPDGEETVRAALPRRRRRCAQRRPQDAGAQLRGWRLRRAVHARRRRGRLVPAAWARRALDAHAGGRRRSTALVAHPAARATAATACRCSCPTHLSDGGRRRRRDRARLRLAARTPDPRGHPGRHRPARPGARDRPQPAVVVGVPDQPPHRRPVLGRAASSSPATPRTSTRRPARRA